MGRERNGEFFADSSGTGRRFSRLALLLALIPFVAVCFSVGFWDRLYPVVAGVPFNIFWLILWTLITPICMWGAYRCEQRNGAENRRVRTEDRR